MMPKPRIKIQKIDKPASFDMCRFCDETGDFLLALTRDSVRVSICNRCLVELLIALPADQKLIKECLVGWKALSGNKSKAKRKSKAKILIDSQPNPYESYAKEFAKTHGLAISEAYKHPMVRSRCEVYKRTGR